MKCAAVFDLDFSTDKMSTQDELCSEKAWFNVGLMQPVANEG